MISKATAKPEREKVAPSGHSAFKKKNVRKRAEAIEEEVVETLGVMEGLEG